MAKKKNSFIRKVFINFYRLQVILKMWNVANFWVGSNYGNGRPRGVRSGADLEPTLKLLEQLSHHTPGLKIEKFKQRDVFSAVLKIDTLSEFKLIRNAMLWKLRILV